VDKDLAPKVIIFGSAQLLPSALCDRQILLLQWDPPAPEYVSKDMVDAYFAPLGEFEPELKLPTESREAFI
jgi:hypothetical protein